MNPVPERCPRCGKSTSMEKGEILAYCSSCKSLHEPGTRSLIDVEIAKASLVSEGQKTYIPFWRFFCDFSINGERSMHPNLSNFIKEGGKGRLFVYVPAAQVEGDRDMLLGAKLTANNPVYASGFSFNDTEHLKCTKRSSEAREEVSFYFLSAETPEGREDDLTSGFEVESIREKLVYIPFYRAENELIAGV